MDLPKTVHGVLYAQGIGRHSSAKRCARIAGSPDIGSARGPTAIAHAYSFAGEDIPPPDKDGMSCGVGRRAARVLRAEAFFACGGSKVLTAL